MEQLSEEKIQWLHTIETFIVVALISYALYGGYVIAQASGHSVSNECQTINDTQGTKVGYGSPLNIFSGGKEQLMKVSCNSSKSATAHLGNGKSGLYIYKYGYNKVDGVWEKVRFEGEKMSGSWIVGTATGEIEGVKEGEKGTVLAYMCQKYDGRWRCGCENYTCGRSKWQLQYYSSSNNEDKDEEIFIKNKIEDDFSGQPFSFDNHPMTYMTSHTHVLPGDKISVSGFGYGEGTTANILWDDKVIKKNITFYEGKNFYFVVPDVDSGKHRVTFEQDGVVAYPDSTVWVKPSSNPTAPKITKISEDVVMQGDTITVYGSGFSSEKNDVVTGFVEISDIPSPDGKSLTFEYIPFPGDELVAYDPDTMKKLKYSMPMHMMVINENGMSNTVFFELKYD